MKKIVIEVSQTGGGYQTMPDVQAPAITLYSALKAAGIVADTHECDLYVPVTPETTKILGEYPLEKSNSSVFKSAIDGVMTYKIPFGFEPLWEKDFYASAENTAKQKE